MLLTGQNPLCAFARLAFAGLMLMLPANAFSHGLNSASESVLAVLQPEDAVPNEAVKLKDLSLTGIDNTHDCAYYELLEKAKSLASEAGANILKIKAKSGHSSRQPCDGLEVSFYKTADPHSASHSFRWDAGTPLSWDDFRGPIRAGTSERTAAETSCGIAVETNLVPAGSKARVFVFNTFDKRTSWVRPGHAHPGVLEHEQGHWDLCELYTRRMQARFDRTQISGANLNRKVNEIYNEVSDDYVKRQEQYERETQHGKVTEAQQRWTRLIAEELRKDMTSR